MLAHRTRMACKVRTARAQTVCLAFAGIFAFTVAGFGGCNRQGTSAGMSGDSWDHQSRETMIDIETSTAIAVRFNGAPDAEGFPPEAAWGNAPPVEFAEDWQGKNADPQRRTEVRLLWAPETFYVRFDAWYRVITVFTDAESDGRRDQLWNRDVCEMFVQASPNENRRYLEFEVAPNGLWIDLDIGPGKNPEFRSGLKRRAQIDEKNKKWRAELAIPMKSLSTRFSTSAIWRANFFRVEGAAEPRFYSAWRPTHTPQPNFHVPEAFGGLVFTEAGAKIRR